MIKIEFNCNQIITVIQANLDDVFQDPINKFLQKTLTDPTSFVYLVDGRVIKPGETIQNQINELTKKNKIVRVIVTKFDKPNQVIIKSKIIICPECNQPCKIKFKDSKILLYDCENNHVSDNIEVSKFDETQKINLSNIICDQCLINNQGLSYNNEFYKCLTCNKNLCLICESKHDNNHIVINSKQKDYKCPKHNDVFFKYCKSCKVNICLLCESEHRDHNTIYFGDIMPKIDELKKSLTEKKKEIDSFKENIKNFIVELNNFIAIIDKYYDINNNLLNNFEIAQKNYTILENINELNNNYDIEKRIKDVNNITNSLLDIMKINTDIKRVQKNIKEKNIKIKENAEKIQVKKVEIKMKRTGSIPNLTSNNLNQMTIKYNIDKKNKKIRLFGKKFVDINKTKCHLLINGKKTDICEELNISKYTKDKNVLEVVLIENKIKSITNMSYIFSGCNSLKSIQDISKWDGRYITNMCGMFFNCILLESLPNISVLDTKNVTNLSDIFKNCISLKSLPDISKWNVKKILI